jgi:hypothetical protein
MEEVNEENTTRIKIHKHMKLTVMIIIEYKQLHIKMLSSGMLLPCGSCKD